MSPVLWLMFDFDSVAPFSFISCFDCLPMRLKAISNMRNVPVKHVTAMFAQKLDDTDM